MEGREGRERIGGREGGGRESEREREREGRWGERRNYKGVGESHIDTYIVLDLRNCLRYCRITIRTFSNIIVFIQRVKNHFQPKSYQYSMVCTRMHTLLFVQTTESVSHWKFV